MHKLLHCLASDLTSLAPGNLERNAQASHNCSSSGSPLSDDQACHNSDSLGLYGQLFHNYSILVNHCNHLDVVSCICCRAATTRSSIEPVYFLRTVLVDPDFLAHSSSYLISEAFHQTHLTYLDYWASLSRTQTFYHFVDSPLPEVDLVVTLPSTLHQHSISHFF